MTDETDVFTMRAVDKKENAASSIEGNRKKGCTNNIDKVQGHTAVASAQSDDTIEAPSLLPRERRLLHPRRGDMPESTVI